MEFLEMFTILYSVIMSCLSDAKNFTFIIHFSQNSEVGIAGTHKLLGRKQASGKGSGLPVTTC